MKKTKINNQLMSAHSSYNKLDSNRSELEFNSNGAENEAKLKRILEATQKIEPPRDLSESQTWEAIQNKLKVDVKKPTTGAPLKMIISYSAAASVILILGLYFLLRNTDTHIIAANGLHIPVYLPDSSEVILNAGSEIIYNENNWANNRQVRLKGEAFFTVKKGSKFIVETNIGSVKVLGTSFNVYDRGTQFKVACFTGKVMVSTQSGAQELIPGLAVSYKSRGQLIVTNFDVNKNDDWRNGKYYFDAIPLQIVFEELERQFNVRVINAGKYANRKYTGNFSNTHLEQALDNICVPMNLNYKISNNQIEILNN